MNVIIHEHRRLHDQNERHSVFEIPMLCLMAADVHAKRRAEAAADESDEKQCFLRNSPFVMLRLLLIEEHYEKSGHIDEQKIEN